MVISICSEHDRLNPSYKQMHVQYFSIYGGECINTDVEEQVKERLILKLLFIHRELCVGSLSHLKSAYKLC